MNEDEQLQLAQYELAQRRFHEVEEQAEAEEYYAQQNKDYIKKLEYDLSMSRGNVDDLRKVRDELEERLYNQAKTIHDLIKDNKGLRKSLAEAYGMMLEDIVDFAEQDPAYLEALRPSILELDEAIKRMK